MSNWHLPVSRLTLRTRPDPSPQADEAENRNEWEILHATVESSRTVCHQGPQPLATAVALP